MDQTWEIIHSFYNFTELFRWIVIYVVNLYKMIFHLDRFTLNWFCKINESIEFFFTQLGWFIRENSVSRMNYPSQALVYVSATKATVNPRRVGFRTQNGTYLNQTCPVMGSHSRRRPPSRTSTPLGRVATIRTALLNVITVSSSDRCDRGRRAASKRCQQRSNQVTA